MRPVDWWDDDALDPITNEVTYRLNGAAMEVHTQMGPGLPEKIYQDCLEIELRTRGFYVDREFKIRPSYKGHELNRWYKADLLVDGEFVLEAKVVSAISEIDVAQALGYLRLLNKRLAIIYNFNVVSMKQGGIRRVLNPYHPGWDESSSSAHSAHSASDAAEREQG